MSLNLVKVWTLDLYSPHSVKASLLLESEPEHVRPLPSWEEDLGSAYGASGLISMEKLLQESQEALAGTQMAWIPVCFPLWLPMPELLLPPLKLRERRCEAWDHVLVFAVPGLMDSTSIRRRLNLTLRF